MMAGADAVDELVWHVDEDDMPLGTVTRRDMRTRNLLHRAVAVACWNGRGQVFVHQRTATKDLFPSCHDMFVSGVVSAGESYDQAAVREIEEELGIQGPEPEFLFRCHFRDGQTQAHIAVYRIQWDGPLVLQESEIQGGRYYSCVELHEAMNDGLAVVPDGAFCWTQLLSRGWQSPG